MQAFPDAARALGDVGLCEAALMHLEVLVGAVAEQLRAAGPEIGEPGDVLFGCRRCRLMKVQRSHVCSLFCRGRESAESPRCCRSRSRRRVARRAVRSRRRRYADPSACLRREGVSRRWPPSRRPAGCRRGCAPSTARAWTPSGSPRSIPRARRQADESDQPRSVFRRSGARSWTARSPSTGTRRRRALARQPPVSGRCLGGPRRSLLPRRPRPDRRRQTPAAFLPSMTRNPDGARLRSILVQGGRAWFDALEKVTIMNVDRSQGRKDITDTPTFRTIDGLSIRFVESEPRRVDALLLSPWPESVLAYEPVWPRLADHAHLVAIDLPGFGRSEGR